MAKGGRANALSLPIATADLTLLVGAMLRTIRALAITPTHSVRPHGHGAVAAALNSLTRLICHTQCPQRRTKRDVALAAGALDVVYELISSPAAASVGLNGLNGLPTGPSGLDGLSGPTDVVFFSLGLLCALIDGPSVPSVRTLDRGHSAHAAHSALDIGPVLREFVTRGATRDIRAAADTALMLMRGACAPRRRSRIPKCACSAVTDGDTAAVMTRLVADSAASASSALGARKRKCLCPFTALSVSVYVLPWDRDMTAMLLAYGADPNERNWADDSVPLHWCLDPDAIALLLRAGAKPDVRDSVGDTPVERHTRHARQQTLAAGAAGAAGAVTDGTDGTSRDFKRRRVGAVVI